MSASSSTQVQGSAPSSAQVLVSTVLYSGTEGQHHPLLRYRGAAPSSTQIQRSSTILYSGTEEQHHPLLRYRGAAPSSTQVQRSSTILYSGTGVITFYSGIGGQHHLLLRYRGQHHPLLRYWSARSSTQVLVSTILYSGTGQHYSLLRYRVVSPMLFSSIPYSLSSTVSIDIELSSIDH